MARNSPKHKQIKKNTIFCGITLFLKPGPKRSRLRAGLAGKFA